jgi:hypothetical protein
MDAATLLATVLHVKVVSQPPAGTDWPGWLTAAGTLVLATGVLFASRQIRESKVARLTEAAAGVSRRWDGPDLIESRAAIDAFGSEDALRDAVLSVMREEDQNTNLDLLLREPNFFDDLGAQEFLGGITLQWIEFTMREIVLDRWNLWEPTVIALREDDPTEPPVYGNFERLTKKLQGEQLGRIQRLKRTTGTWLVRRLGY